MTKQRVALFEFPTRAGIAPLATAYLQSFAQEDERVRDHYSFSLNVLSVAEEDLIDKVLAVDAEIYGLSTYVWNSRLVRRVVDALHAFRPTAWIILGGPQVMNGAAEYLQADCDRLLLCNGEGEHTFRQFLLAMLDPEPDLAQVQGLSYYREGVLTTTEPCPRMRDLDSIPSPFLNGLIDPAQSSFVSFETNRGCPFKCTYCFWGGATNAKVHKFGKDRVFEEIDWIADNHIDMVFLIDANFGMLQRDVDIAQYFVECKKRTGFPKIVFINSSKNTPERVSEITKMWHEVGLIAAQPVSMQTMSPEALEAIERDNIKDSTYTELQRTLNIYGLQSFLEMIWPLPGETLASFRDGLDALCRMNSDSFVVYPLMLIRNVKMATQRELYGLETIEDPDPCSEAEIVVSTSRVTNEEYQIGINLTYHMTALYSFMALRHTMEYVDQNGGKTFTEIAGDFWRFCQQRPTEPYTKFVNGVSSMTGFNAGAGGFIALGGAMHTALFSGVLAFERTLYEFAGMEGWLDDEEVRLRFEIDMLNRPILYSNAAIPDKKRYLSLLTIEDTGRDSLTIRVPPRHRAVLAQTVHVDMEDRSEAARLRIDYRTPSQIPFAASQPARYYHFHVQARTRGDIRSLAPQWTVEDVRTEVPAMAVLGRAVKA